MLQCFLFATQLAILSQENAEKKTSPVDSELDHYLNRNYWEQRQQQQKEEGVLSPTDSRNSPTPSAPVSSSAPSYTSNRQTEVNASF